MLRKTFFAAACFALGMASSPIHAQRQVPPENLATSVKTIVIASGNTFQTILAAVTGQIRNSLTIQNNNTNGDQCWIFIGSGGATKATSILLGQGGSYQRYVPYIPSDAIQATCATSADTLYMDVQ